MHFMDHNHCLFLQCSAIRSYKFKTPSVCLLKQQSKTLFLFSLCFAYINALCIKGAELCYYAVFA